MKKAFLSVTLIFFLFVFVACRQADGIIDDCTTTQREMTMIETTITQSETTTESTQTTVTMNNETTVIEVESVPTRPWGGPLNAEMERTRDLLLEHIEVGDSTTISWNVDSAAKRIYTLGIRDVESITVAQWHGPQPNFNVLILRAVTAEGQTYHFVFDAGGRLSGVARGEWEDRIEDGNIIWNSR